LMQKCCNGIRKLVGNSLLYPRVQCSEASVA
jgi:hypothetical protein